MEDSYSGNPECIPEETSEYMTDNGNTDTDASDSPHTVSEDEISWADTLKCYSQPQQEKYSPKEVHYLIDSFIVTKRYVIFNGNWFVLKYKIRDDNDSEQVMIVFG